MYYFTHREAPLEYYTEYSGLNDELEGIRKAGFQTEDIHLKSQELITKWLRVKENPIPPDLMHFSKHIRFMIHLAHNPPQ